MNFLSVTTILGISAYFHDAAAAIIVDGVVVAAAQEERFTRKKHDESFPINSIEFCLDEAKIKIEDLDFVAFYEKPFLKFERILETHLAFAPRGLNSFLTAMPIWLKSKLYLSRLIRKGLKHRFKKRIVYPQHHESHAASAFFTSPFDTAAILTVDGVGEWATTSLGSGNGNEIELTHEIAFPDSLGLLYSAFTYFCGFRVNGGEGKLMGLAPYGNTVYVKTILENLVDLKDDGSIRLNQDFFNYCTGDTMTSKKFDVIFGGPPRIPESEIKQREKDLAASIQAVTEMSLLKMASHLHAHTGEKNLVVAGGVGLNCVANGRLRRESPFENVWVQPAAGDSGGAVGAALFVWHQLLGKPRDSSAKPWSVFLGPCCTEVESTLKSRGAEFEEIGEHELTGEVAKLLVDQKVIGWVQDSMELGPRALGNRSILADARDPEMQSKLNQKIKFRESFRPFGPAVLLERANEFFEDPTPSPHMLFATSVHHSKRNLIPAVTHVNGSARMQTVSQKNNKKLHSLLTRFDELTGCPMLLNTSFNVRGEPMVCSVEDAYRCFLSTGMDVLVIENYVLKKENQPEYCDDGSDPDAKETIIHKIAGVFSTITFPIRWLVSRFVLTAVFLIFITPIGFVWRELNKDHSFQPIDRKQKSYWRPRKPTKNKSSYFKQY